MASHRRKEKEYGTNVNATYSESYVGFRNASKILNAERIPNVHSIIADKETMSSLLIELVGNNNGEYMEDGDWRTAFIPTTRGKLGIIKAEFEARKKQARNEGRQELTAMPDDLLVRKYTQEARLDVYLEEKDLLEERLKALAEVKEERDNKMLVYGLQGTGKFWGTGAPSKELVRVLHFIDGQECGQTADGLLIIIDDRSPYRGMAVVDYRVLCMEWYKSRKQMAKEKLKIAQAEARERGIPLPGSYAMPNVKVPLSSLPKWPSGVRNWLKAESSTARVRTK
jgi:hypothetical protein